MGRANPGRRRTLIWAIGLSLVAHAVVLGVLVRRQAAPLMAPAPTVEVELVRPSTRPVAPPPASEGTFRPTAAAEAKTVAKAEATPVTPAPASPPAAPPTPVAVPPPPSAAALQGALRNSLGCREAVLPSLSPAERRKCEDELADRLGDGDGRYGMDPKKRAGFAVEGREREPFLARAPKDNCVPQLTQKDVGQGAKAVHEWKFKTACAKSF
jgi:hypothetical protein